MEACRLFSCPDTTSEKEPGVSDRPASGLMDGELTCPKQDSGATPHLCDTGQARHGSRLCSPEEGRSDQLSRELTSGGNSLVTKETSQGACFSPPPLTGSKGDVWL